jgi:chorismate synthase
MSSEFGNNIRIKIFGQSHSPEIGVIIEGLPAGEQVDMIRMQAFLNRRKGGTKSYTTPRSESDEPQIVSGIENDMTDGNALHAIFVNANVMGKDYSMYEKVPRPSHVDYYAKVKYGEGYDVSGGGHFSGRLTLPLCFAGEICKQILERHGIFVGAHISSVAGIVDEKYDTVKIFADELLSPGMKEFPVINDGAGEMMIEKILEAKYDGDSVGGTIECAIIGLPIGVGDHMFEGIENQISKAVFGIPGVKGIEFGAGFQAANMRGSEHNDAYVFENGEVKTKTNNAGGIVGGMSTGMPVIFNLALKPTPSIALAQDSVNLLTGENVKISIQGRHDPCIVPRAVPCVEAATAVVMLDMITEFMKEKGTEHNG